MKASTGIRLISVPLALSVMGSCKPSVVAQDDAQTAAAAETALRNQGANGSCWIYSYGTMLNETIIRQRYRRATGHPDPNAFWERDSGGGPLSLDGHLKRIRANGGELVPHGSLPAQPDVAAMPKVSINALIYTHYMHRLAEWLGSFWPNFLKYNADGGHADEFNSLFKKGLLTTQQFPDGDFTPSSLDETTRSSLCGGKERSQCNPTSIVEIVNTSGLYRKEPALQKSIIQQLLETPYHVPEPFRVKVNGGKLSYPIIESESLYRSPTGAVVARKDLAEVLWRLPADIRMWMWARGFAGSAIPSRIDMWNRWRGLTQMDYPNAQEMSEIAAILVILNQPATFAVQNWSLAGLQANEIRPGGGGKDNLGGHAMMLFDYEVKGGRLVLKIRNSWGKNYSDLSFSDFEKSQWDISFPAYLWEQAMLPYRDTHGGKCEGMSGNTLAFAAAYQHLKDKGYRGSGNSLNDKMLAFASKCSPISGGVLSAAAGAGSSAASSIPLGIIECPAGYHLEKVGEGHLCSDGKNALGPFTSAMVAKCVAWGGGAEICKTERWAFAVARDARGAGKCPLGSQQDAVTGYCVEGGNAFGPFPKSLVTKCQGAGGGQACGSARWSLGFLKQLMGK